MAFDWIQPEAGLEVIAVCDGFMLPAGAQNNDVNMSA